MNKNEADSFKENHDVLSIDSTDLKNTITAPPFIVPVIQEELIVRKQQIHTGTVRLTKTVQDREEFINEPVVQRTVEIERVSINKVVDGPVQVRQEGEVTIYPVMEEVLVITKQYLLKEEVRITHRVLESIHQQRILLRSEEVVTERDDSFRGIPQGK